MDQLTQIFSGLGKPSEKLMNKLANETVSYTVLKKIHFTMLYNDTY